MGVETIILALVKDGSVAALVIAITIVLAIVFFGLFLRNRAVVSIGAKDKLVDNSQIVSIQEQLGAIASKVNGLERDVHDRATKDEVHQIELSVTRMEGRIDAMATTVQATAHGVSRIEQFMLAAALQTTAPPMAPRGDRNV